MWSSNIPIWLQVLLVSMATWRLASLFAFEKGPFDIFVKIRSKLFVWANTTTGDISKILFTLNDGINCLWCNSVWFGLLLSFVVARNIFEWFIIGLCASTFAIFLEGIINGKNIDKNIS